MDIKNIYNLIIKYKENKCSAEEVEEINRWYAQFEEDAENIPSVPSEKLEQLYFDIEGRIKSHATKRKSLLKRRVLWISTGVAASVLLALFVVFNYIDTSKSNLLSQVAEDIDPGVWQAELIISDGSKVLLSDNMEINDQGTIVKNESEKGLSYGEVEEENETVTYHTINVPLGQEFAVALSDGTNVHLNSGSSLTYPVPFSKEKREVTFHGEGYFDVKSSSVPFVVNSMPFDIEVLGTAFNFSTYENDQHAVATLVNGSILIKREEGKTHKLEPGHQYLFNKESGKSYDYEVDTDIYTSWVRGEFKFRDMRLEVIMKRLSRWYNCDVIYEKPFLKELRFSGSAEKTRPLSYALDMIEHVTDIEFVIEDNKVIVRVKH